MWFDMLLIPADAKNAHKLINFLMRPEIIAEITDYVWYANPNPAANALIDSEIANDPAIYPTAAVRNNLFINTQVPPKVAKVRNRTWTEIKSGR